MIIAGNPKEGLAEVYTNYIPRAVYCSRTTGYDLTQYRSYVYICKRMY